MNSGECSVSNIRQEFVDNPCGHPQRRFMKRRLKTADHPKSDLSFIPPVTEHVQYIELAHRFMAEDPEGAEASADPQTSLSGIQFRKKRRANKAA